MMGLATQKLLCSEDLDSRGLLRGGGILALKPTNDLSLTILKLSYKYWKQPLSDLPMLFFLNSMETYSKPVKHLSVQSPLGSVTNSHSFYFVEFELVFPWGFSLSFFKHFLSLE